MPGIRVRGCGPAVRVPWWLPAGAALWALAPAIAAAADWPQAAANPQRTCHVADEPKGPYKLAWVKHWGREALFNTSQPIIVGGVVYVGTQNGFVHAVHADGGKDKWTHRVGSPVVHALACDGRLVFAAAIDGSVRALDRETGHEAWRRELSRRGFCAAPLLMDGALYVGSRDGLVYAIDAAKGTQLWKRDTGAPIFQTAAGVPADAAGAGGGRVVVANEAMVAFCLDAESGRIVWKSEPIVGVTMRDYWPVIHRGKVILCPTGTGNEGERELQETVFGPAQAAKPKFKATSVEEVIREQDLIVDFYRTHPGSERRTVVFNLSDGEEPYIASAVRGCYKGTMPPVVVAGDGEAYTPFRTSAADDGLRGKAPTHAILGRLDLGTGRIATPLLCAGFELAALVGTRSPFELTGDETVTLSSGGNLLLGLRVDAGGGAIDIRTRQTAPLPEVPLPRATDMNSSGNILAVSGRFICYTKQNHVVCIAGRQLP